MTSPKFSPAQAIKSSEITDWHIETDVAIVGFGGAGGCAAIEAAEAGAKVVVFEVASAIGGSTALSGGELYLGGSGGTAIQKQHGFTDSSENMFDYLMMQHAPQADEEKIRAYVDGAAAHLDWLVERGVPFKGTFLDERLVEPMTDDTLIWCGNEKAWPEVEQCAPVPRGHVVQMEGMGAGKVLMETLHDNALSLGVSIQCESRVLCLVVSDNGEVEGLIVRQDGKELTCRATSGVVLCAGGFIMNESMVKTYAPRLTRAQPIGNPGDTGSGIQMGVSVGGAAINMHEGFTSIPFYPPATTTFGIIVTDKGHRFINEDVYHGRVGTHLLEQNCQRAYLILDVEAYGTYEEMNFLNAGIVATGDTIEELEEALNITAGALSQTLLIYNRHAASGEDPLFHKQAEWLRPLEAPFVALDVSPDRGCFVPSFTLGGLDTLPTGEVLRPDGSPIEGLYAAGRTAAGVPRRGAGYSSGISVGDATFSGRRAGASAALRRRSQ